MIVFFFKLVVKGIASQQCQPDVRLPITMDILTKMLHALPVVHINPQEVCMYRGVLVAGFYGLMHVLLVQGVQLQSHRVVLTLNSSKANKSNNPEVITLLAQEPSPCPVKLIWDYAKIRPHVAGPFFLWSDNSPLQYSDLAVIVHLLAQCLELPHQYFKPHGLRIRGKHSCTFLGCNQETFSRWTNGHLGPSANIPVNYKLFLAVQNRVWFIGDHQLQLAFEVLMKHKDRFHQLDLLEGFNSRFTEEMMLEHMLATVLDMVNRYKYLPELTVIHVGASDFSRVTNH